MMMRGGIGREGEKEQSKCEFLDVTKGVEVEELLEIVMESTVVS